VTADGSPFLHQIEFTLHYRHCFIGHIMLRDLLTQKCVNKIKVTDFRYTRACRFRKTKQINQSLSEGETGAVELAGVSYII
jgi:hypothetical protein